jgi:hypothetical protein
VDLYGYYGRTERMMENLLRDEDLVATVKRSFSRYHGYLAAAREVLMAGRGLRGVRRRRVEAAIGHALAFATWRSLVRDQGLEDEAAAELMCRLAAAAG